MFEKVNKFHPDKLCDRISGAIVDAAYSMEDSPKIAVEVMLGHGECYILNESSVCVPKKKVEEIVHRIAGDYIFVHYENAPQDYHLADNQKGKMRCGDNGIFRGVPITGEQSKLTKLARYLTVYFPYDGKYVIDKDKLIICQSNATIKEIEEKLKEFGELPSNIIINPLGYWTGGSNVDTGAVNRKLGSDMADSITGGGLSGKDLSKADVSINIYAWLKAQQTGEVVELSCAIGDEYIDGKPYSEIVEIARDYIMNVHGSFEKFAEWGLV